MQQNGVVSISLPIQKGNKRKKVSLPKKVNWQRTIWKKSCSCSRCSNHGCVIEIITKILPPIDLISFLPKMLECKNCNIQNGITYDCLCIFLKWFKPPSQYIPNQNGKLKGKFLGHLEAIAFVCQKCDFLPRKNSFSSDQLLQR